MKTQLAHYFQLINHYFLSKTYSIFIIYLFIVIFIFRNILFSPGAIIGADWALPVTYSQVEVNYTNSTYTWIDQGILFGNRQSIFTPLPYHFISRLIMKLGVQPDVYTRVFLGSLFYFSALSMYVLLKKLNILHYSALLGGLIYITTPIFFNYAIMGWTFVLMYFALLPLMVLVTIKSVQTGSIRYPIMLGLMFSFSVIQSQSVIWTPCILLALSLYLVKDKRTFWLYVRTLFITIIIFLGLNLYWISGLLLVPDQNIAGSDIVTSSVSMGTMGHFRPVNIIRLFGSLFNFQYELAVGDSPTVGQSLISLLSFVLPIIVFASLFLKSHKRIIKTLWLIAIIPVLVYFINYYRSLLIYLPYANVLRDFARFTVLTSFAYAALASFVFDSLLKNKNKFALVLIVLWLISVFPWWTGEISWWEHRTLGDVRMRTKVFTPDYFELEEKLNTIDEEINILYFPTNSILDFTDDEKYHGTFNGIVDVFAAYSPRAGSIYTSDRNDGYLGPYLKLLNTHLNPEFNPQFFDDLKLTNVRYIVFRKNVMFPNSDIILKELENRLQKGELSKYFDSQNLIVFERKQYLPRIYASQNLLFSTEKNQDLQNLTFDLIIYKEQNQNFDTANAITLNSNPKVSFHKNNPTQYKVNINHASGWFGLVLNQTFHDQWSIYGSGLSGLNTEVLSPYHMIANGWSNVWLLNTDEMCQTQVICSVNEDGTRNLELNLLFKPQLIFNYGLIISIAFLTLTIVVLIINFIFKR